MPSPILARADALMQRRMHNQPAHDDVPTLTEAIGDDGIPLLLDADALPQTEMPAPEAPPAAAPPPATEDEWVKTVRLDTSINEILATELARRVEQRIAAELPRIVAATLEEFLAEQRATANPAQ